MIKELCTEDINQAIRLSPLVDQIEFCSDLQNDGLTPKLLDACYLKTKIQCPIKIMIRSRAGNFEYSNEELETMKAQSKEFMINGFDRFVFGALKNKRLDIEMIKDFCQAVYPSKVCIHKAIDESTHIIEDAKLLTSISNINEILSSGGKATAQEGAEVLKEMIRTVSPKINVVCAGKITHNNLESIHSLINGSHYHGKLIVGNG